MDDRSDGSHTWSCEERNVWRADRTHTDSPRFDNGEVNGEFTVRASGEQSAIRKSVHLFRCTYFRNTVAWFPGGHGSDFCSRCGISTFPGQHDWGPICLHPVLSPFPSLMYRGQWSSSAPPFWQRPRKQTASDSR